MRMATFIKYIHQIGEKFDYQAQGMAFRHPYTTIFVMFIVIPICILLAVALLTMLVTTVVMIFF